MKFKSTTMFYLLFLLFFFPGSGTAAILGFDVDPLNLDFGDVEIGTRSEIDIRLYSEMGVDNQGYLRLFSFRILDDNNFLSSSPFDILQFDPNPFLTGLHPGQHQM